MTTRTRLVLAAALILPAAPHAAAQWPADPAANLPVATGPSDQAVPKIAAAPDGSCWIGWFESAAGGYQCKVQRLDPDGAPTFPGGLLVSDNPQQSFLTDWDLTCDADGAVALVFSDIRDGGDLDVHAYRILPDGAFAWGADGVTLSDNADFEPSPRITATSDGQFVAVWARLPSGAVAGDLRMQRITDDGQLLLAPGGQVVVGPVGAEQPGFCDVVPSVGGSVIVSWLRDIRIFSSPRHLRAMRFDVAGSPMWGSAANAFDLGSLPIGYYPRSIPDGAGGVVLAWHASIANEFNAYVQRLDSDGAEVFPHNGVQVAAAGGQYEMSPDVAYDEANGDIWVAYHLRNTLQNMWGTNFQRIDAGGNRLLGPAGAVLKPLDAFEDRSPRIERAQGSPEAVVAWFDFPTGSVVNSRVIATRIDANGLASLGAPPSMPAEPGFVAVCSTLSGKDDLETALDACGRVLMVWQDSRDGTGDMYAQNVNRNGTIGPDCPMDIDGDGNVGFPDLNVLLGVYGQSAAPGALPGDADCDGTIGFPDLNLLLGVYGQGC